jgi:predicted lysophospholipase L1 biosynthesis ABC-type transport system permease subunit
VRYRIVGRVVIPSVVDPAAVADGALMTGAGLGRLENAGNLSAGVAPVVHFRPGGDRAAAEREIERMPGVGRPGNGILAAHPPLEVRRVEQLDRLPLFLALFLVVIGAVAVGHLLVTSVQRRRHDFAVLKSLGFCRSQTYRTVFVQATTVALVGIVIGLVVGTALGALVWRAAAGRVGVLAEVEISGIALTLIGLATVLLANLVAAIPARTAARTPVAVALRTD